MKLIPIPPPLFFFTTEVRHSGVMRKPYGLRVCVIYITVHNFTRVMRAPEKLLRYISCLRVVFVCVVNPSNFFPRSTRLVSLANFSPPQPCRRDFFPLRRGEVRRSRVVFSPPGPPRLGPIMEFLDTDRSRAPCP